MICLMHIYLITAQNPAFCCLMVTFHWVFKTLKMLTTSYWQFLVLVISSSCSSTDLPPFLKCSNASNKLNRRQKVLQMFGSWTILLLQGKSTHTTVQCCLSPTQDIIDPIWEFHAGQPVYQILSYSKAKAGQIQSWNIKCITLKSLLYLILFLICFHWHAVDFPLLVHYAMVYFREFVKGWHNSRHLLNRLSIWNSTSIKKLQSHWDPKPTNQ